MASPAVHDASRATDTRSGGLRPATAPLPAAIRFPVPSPTLPASPDSPADPAPPTRRPRSLRERLFATTLVIAGGMGLGLVVIVGAADDRRLRDEAERRMGAVAAATATHLDVWIGVHERAVRAAARQVARAGAVTRATAEPRLLDTHAATTGFLTLLAADDTGTIVAASPARRADGSDALLPTRSAADRAYFREPRRTGGSYVSGAFRGRGFGADPIVAIASAVRAPDGRFLGIVEGSLALDALGRLVSGYDAGIGVVITDPAGVVVAASPGVGWRPLDTLPALRPAAAGRAALDVGAQGAKVLVLETRDRRGWIVRAEYRLAELRAQQRAWLWWLAAVVALVVAAGSVASARLLAAVTAPLERLTRGLRERELCVVDELRADPRLAAAPREVQELVGVLATQRGRIEATKALLRTTIEERELVIAERTRDLRRLAMDLADAKDHAENASRAKSEFLARMSHELRTPLNSVIGFTQQVLKLRAKDLAPREVLMLERAVANGRHLLALINDILDLARVEAGKVQFAIEPVDVAALVRDVVAGLEGQARPAGLALVADVPPALPPVAADAARLRQVLVNLVGNALKFTAAGEVRVTVEPGPDGAPAAIAVRDTGIGIAPERQAAVFQAFEQADAFTTRQFGGTGLGLAISRQLCHGMGADLVLESTPGVGSTFRVVFGAAGSVPAAVASSALPVAARPAA